MFSLIQAILPIFKHFEENIVRWVGQLLDIIQVSNQHLEELKKTVFVLWVEFLQEQKWGSRNNTKAAYPFYPSQNLPIHL